MQILKTFGNAYYKSISSLEYYKDVVEAKTSFSLNYILALGTVFTIISTVNFSVRIYPQVREFIDKLPAEISRIYPNELVITGKDNQWFINQPEPYTIQMPYKNQLKGSTGKNIENLIVFDKKGTLETYPDYNTLVLVSEKFLYIKDNNKQINATPITEVPQGSFSKQNLQQYIGEIMPFVKSLLGFVPFIIATFYLIGNTSLMLIYTLILGLLLLVSSAVFKKSLTFHESFRVGIHAITLPWTIQVLISLLGVTIPIPLWFTLLALMVGVSAIYSLPPRIMQNQSSLN